MVDALVGTSGWHYTDWKGVLYGPHEPQDHWLAVYASRYRTVELNNSFYRLPDRLQFDAWRTQVPEGFVFSVKVSRYLTHVRRLKDPQDPVKRLLEASEGLGPTVGPYLVQLPPNLKADPEALDATLAAFGQSRQVAVEFRHDSWNCPEVRKVLERRQAACCWPDRRGMRGPQWRTASWGYIRFHEGRASPSSCYGRTALRSAAALIAGAFADADQLYVYFNNDRGGCAVRNADTFLRYLNAALG